MKQARRRAEVSRNSLASQTLPKPPYMDATATLAGLDRIGEKKERGAPTPENASRGPSRASWRVF
jgi:hypothetical protein